MANTAIAAQALDKWFGEGEARTRALMQVSFEAYFNEMLFIVGPSGSGKTTLLSVISGILRPDGGHAVVDGVAPNHGGERCDSAHSAACAVG